MKIIIKTVPHSTQRYSTAGDWQFLPGQHEYSTDELVNGQKTCKFCAGTQRENEWAVVAHGKEPHCDKAPQVLNIRVSAMSDWRHEALIAVHELLEALLCKYGEIPESEVDRFDIGYKGDYLEPGDDPAAPYHSEHVFASQCEVRLAGEMEVDWQAYEEEVAGL